MGRTACTESQFLYKGDLKHDEALKLIMAGYSIRLLWTL